MPAFDPTGARAFKNSKQRIFLVANGSQLR